MGKYLIADFCVSMNCQSPFMQKLIQPYNIDNDMPVELDLNYDEKESQSAEFEYNYTLGQFVKEIVNRGAFCFHASALSVDGEAILFSADSGTGKSTHTRLWKKYITDHEVIQLNDDKPIIRFTDHKPYVYGSPWSGKHSIHTNERAPLKAIVFLERGKENKIECVQSQDIFSLVFSQVFGGKTDSQELMKLLELIDCFVKGINVYRLQCTISEEAVRLVYDTVWGGKKDED